eukprot:Opistho-2@90910
MNAHALVNAAFRVRTDAARRTIEDATIVIGAVGPRPVFAKATAASLVGKPLARETLVAALAALQQEVHIEPERTKPAYRKSLALSLFYKFFLSMLECVPPRMRSAAVQYTRSPSSGTQAFKCDPSEAPVSLPIHKLEAKIQATGEAEYTDDLPASADDLHGAFVGSTRASARIVSIDASAALSVDGVHGFVCARDIPGKNDCGFIVDTEELFASSIVSYYGQPIGLVVAVTRSIAQAAAKLVTVEYEVKTPIFTIDDAIKAGSFFELNDPLAKVVSGDVDSALKQCDFVCSGEVRYGDQSHFYMEPQATYAVPSRDGSGMVVHASTQDPTGSQNAVATVLGCGAHDVVVSMKRCGGGFGGKLTRNYIVAAAAAVAVSKFQRPVRLTLDRNTDMDMVGGRHPWYAKYALGFSKTGQFKAFDGRIYMNGGAFPDLGPDTITIETNLAIDSCYYFENFRVEGMLCKTNLPPNTAMRAPGHFQAALLMETAIEHAASKLGVPPEALREQNFYREPHMRTPIGQLVTHYTLPRLWTQVQASSDFKTRLAAVDTFNAANRWRKRGISCCPVKYGVNWAPAGSLVNVYGRDGTVVVSSGGTEIGQGLNTKVAQAAAYALGCPFASVRIAATATDRVANTFMTGGSVGSGTNAEATRLACEQIARRLDPTRIELRTKLGREPTWQELTAAAHAANVELSSLGRFVPVAVDGNPSLASYFNFGVAVTEVEVDVLTGEPQILRADILYDCGISLNPAVDIGQVEGAFVLGIGYILREEHQWDYTVGNKISNGTWEYKPPCVEDIPIDLRVELLKDSPFPKGILRSKASGEPPLILATTVLLAVQHAVAAARADAGQPPVFVPQNTPLTIDVIQQSCGTDVSQLSY